MKYKLPWLLLFLTLITGHARGSEKGTETGAADVGPGNPQTTTISGRVTDAATGEVLIGATIYAPELERGTSTNAYGFFSLSLPPGTARIVVSYVGYAAQIFDLDVAPGTRLEVALEPAAGTLEEVVIVAGSQDRPERVTRMSAHIVSAEEIRQVPALMGETDVLKALQLLPGIRGGAEGSAGLHVRGGSPDQTLILLDGVPVYNANHLFGFVSVFNSDAINRVEVIRGGFPARYGGRLSSVVDIRLREGNMRRFGIRGTVGLLSSRLMVEGPIVRDRGSFLLSGRRTYIDMLVAPFLAEEDDRPVAYFYDINAKANYRISDRDRVYLSLYTGRDRLGAESRGLRAEPRGDVESIRNSAAGRHTYESSGFVDWGNITGTMRWTRVISDRLFGAATLILSDYEFELTASDRHLVGGRWTESRARYSSGIRDLGARVQFDYAPHRSHAVTFGGEMTRHRYSPGAIVLTDPEKQLTLGSDPMIAHEFTLYVEDEIELGRRASANVGLHGSTYAVDGTTYTSLQPRLMGRYQLTERLAVKASAVTMQQYVHLLTSASGLGLPTDLWVPSTPGVPPGFSWQVAAGLAGSVPRAHITWTLESYLKRMSSQIAYRDGASFAAPGVDWQDLVVLGDGRAYGIEAHITRSTEATTWNAAYALARSERRFDEVTEGRWFPYRYDRIHDVSLSMVRRLSPRWNLSVLWVFGTGDAITIPLATHRAIEMPDQRFFMGTVPYYGQSRNAFRLPNYHRLDLDLTWTRRSGPREHRLSLGAYNVYNRRNPFMVTMDENRTSPSGDTAFLRGFALFPVLPSIAYSFSF
jgi:outer membrane receptor for ferrienterochelin and colicin